MATPNVRDILRVPGRLAINPTNLTTAYPHGGTALGIVHDIAEHLESSYQWVTAEEYGNQKVEGTITKIGCALGFVLRGWDNDAITRLFPNTVTGTVTGKRRVQEPGTIKPGERLSSRSVILVFSPDDKDRHPMFLMRRALPAVEETMEIKLHLDEDFGIPVVFYGIRDANGKLYDWGLPYELQPVL